MVLLLSSRMSSNKEKKIALQRVYPDLQHPLAFCSNRGMILEAFSKGIKLGFIALFLPIVTIFPSLR